MRFLSGDDLRQHDDLIQPSHFEIRDLAESSLATIL